MVSWTLIDRSGLVCLIIAKQNKEKKKMKGKYNRASLHKPFWKGRGLAWILETRACAVALLPSASESAGLELAGLCPHQLRDFGLKHRCGLY